MANNDGDPRPSRFGQSRSIRLSHQCVHATHEHLACFSTLPMLAAPPISLTAAAVTWGAAEKCSQKCSQCFLSALMSDTVVSMNDVPV